MVNEISSRCNASEKALKRQLTSQGTNTCHDLQAKPSGGHFGDKEQHLIRLKKDFHQVKERLDDALSQFDEVLEQSDLS